MKKMNDITIEDWEKILNPRCVSCKNILPPSYNEWKCEKCLNEVKEVFTKWNSTNGEDND